MISRSETAISVITSLQCEEVRLTDDELQRILHPLNDEELDEVIVYLRIGPTSETLRPLKERVEALRSKFLEIMVGQQYPAKIRRLLQIGEATPLSIVFDQEKWESEVSGVCHAAAIQLFKHGSDFTMPKDLYDLTLKTSDNSEEQRKLINQKLRMYLSYFDAR